MPKYRYLYEPNENWTYADGTQLKQIELDNGLIVDGNELQEPISKKYYYIVSSKCTECTGFHEEPQCAAVCPVDCCVPDPDYVETAKELLLKKAWLHQE